MTTIDDIKAANAAIGHHFFEPETMTFFNSRIHSKVYEGPGGVYFVTSEKDPWARREYSVRRAHPDGRIETYVGSAVVEGYSSLIEAHREARRLAKGDV